MILSACGPKAEPARPAATTPGPDSTLAVASPAVSDTPAPTPAPGPTKPAASSPKPTPPAPRPAPKPAPPPTAAPAPVRDEWHPPPRDTLDNETYQGWKQFELNCARCHGEYAVGTSFAPALVVSLKEGGTVPTKEAFMTTVCAGRPDKGMPAWCALGLEISTIERIYRYVKGRADGKIGIGRPALHE